jgi:hypothetical protein
MDPRCEHNPEKNRALKRRARQRPHEECIRRRPSTTHLVPPFVERSPPFACVQGQYESRRTTLRRPCDPRQTLPLGLPGTGRHRCAPSDTNAKRRRFFLHLTVFPRPVRVMPRPELNQRTRFRKRLSPHTNVPQTGRFVQSRDVCASAGARRTAMASQRAVVICRRQAHTRHARRPSAEAAEPPAAPLRLPHEAFVIQSEEPRRLL